VTLATMYIMKKFSLIIGIDPDCDKNGVAILQNDKSIELFNYDFISTINLFAKCDNDAIIVIEAGYLNKSNWHITNCKSKQMAAQIGNKTGRNHQTAMLLVQFAKRYNLNVIEKKPLKKIWSNGKISDVEIKKFMNIKGRTNQEKRDAALLAWNEAGFSIKI
jgi:hypothetical protein